jgi:hypothetical protein
MVIYEYEVPGGALNLHSTKNTDHGRHGNQLGDSTVLWNQLGNLLFLEIPQ